MRIQKSWASAKSGQALIIVLGYVALITLLVVTLLLIVSFEQNNAHGYFAGAKAQIGESGAAVQIISDLQQQIASGSSLSSGVYTPTAPVNMVPAISGFTTGAGLENLVTVSNSTGTGRASSISTSAPNPEGLYVTNSTWNKMLFLSPKSSTDYTPSSGNFVPPSWIYTAHDGSNPKTWSGNYVAGGSNPVGQRYAFAIYDEGGMLDLNVAGGPVNNAAQPLGGVACLKNSLAYADLTQIPGISSTALSINGVSTPTLSVAQQATVINAIVGWRNHSSSQATGTIASGFTFPNPAVGLTPFDQSIRASTTGYLSVGAFNAGSQQPDSAFTSRQELFSFLNDCFSKVGLSTSNVTFLLQYVSHYSRGLNQPSYAPSASLPAVAASAAGGNDLAGSTQAKVNPSFLTVTVKTAFIRNDGSLAVVGEPLVKSRFPLQRLSWLTYLGPSATRNFTAPSNAPFSSTNPAAGQDYDVYLLETSYGIAPSYLSQGNAAAVYKSFGLSWVQDNRVDINGNPLGGGAMKWVYNHNLPNPAPGLATSPITTVNGASGTPIKTLSQVQLLGREPDFIELLKASITAGSIAKPGTTAGAISTPSGYQNAKDASLDAAIIQLAANIIDQYDTDGVPTCILFNDGTWADGITPAAEEYRGVEDVPYIYEVNGGFMAVQDSNPSTLSSQGSYHDGSVWVLPSPPPTPPAVAGPALTTPGIAAAFQLPIIWDPHAYSTNSAVGPRPFNFRLVAQDAPPYQNGPPALDPNQFFVQSYGRYNTYGGTLQPYQYPGMQWAPAGTAPQQTVSLTPANTELDFQIPTNRLDLFREPTILQKPNVPAGSNLTTGGSHLIRTDPALTPYLNGGSVQPQAVLGGAAMYTNLLLPDNMQYLGIYLGSFPLRWTSSVAGVGTVVYTASIGKVSGGNQSITYRLQAQNPINGLWYTYDEKYTQVTYGGQTNTPNQTPPAVPPINVSDISAPYNDGVVWAGVDPRSGRWGFSANGVAYNAAALYQSSPAIYRWAPGFGGTPAYTNARQAGWAGFPGQFSLASYQNAASQNAIWTNRPDISSGFSFNGPPAALGFVLPGLFRPGVVCQNNANPNAMNSNNRISYGPVGNQSGYNGGEPGTTAIPQYFADPDGVVRRGMSAYLTPDPTVPLTASATPSLIGAASGNPLNLANTYSAAGVATPIAAEAPSRPIVLNRPFESVAEMGCAFSGTPWRNLDFFTPESGNAALLDVFCVADQSTNLTAGVVDLNTRQAPVLQAVLSGSYEDELNHTTAVKGTTGTSSANALATAITKRTSDLTGALGAGSGPFENLTDLVGKWNKTVAAPGGYVDGSQTFVGVSGTQAPQAGSIPVNPPNFSYVLSQDATSTGYTLSQIQRFRESYIRALSAVGQVRVWNLCIDLISQSGRFSPQASGLDQFHIDAESRCLVHVSIDRNTGKVLDEQIEQVNQ